MSRSMGMLLGQVYVWDPVAVERSSRKDDPSLHPGNRERHDERRRQPDHPRPSGDRDGNGNSKKLQDEGRLEGALNGVHEGDEEDNEKDRVVDDHGGVPFR